MFIETEGGSAVNLMMATDLIDSSDDQMIF